MNENIGRLAPGGRQSSALGNLSIAAKLNLVLLVVMLTIFGLLAGVIYHWLAREVENRMLENLERTNRQVAYMIDAYAGSLEYFAETVAKQFVAGLPEGLRRSEAERLDTAGRSLPVLLHGQTPLNNRFELVDGFSARTGGVATFFVRDGEDFVRISTSLKKQNGERAIGTALDRQHPAWARLSAGEAFTGKATLFGRDYMTRYMPVKDGRGEVIGLVFIGIDFTEGLAALKRNILSVRIGRSGYVQVLDSGKDAGLAVIHPSREGARLLEDADPGRAAATREMLAKKEGVIHAEWAEAGQSGAQEHIVSVLPFAKWNWLIASSIRQAELDREVFAVQVSFFVVLGLIAAVLFICVAWCTRKWVSQPVAEVLHVTEAVAQGDLTVSVPPSRSNDEAGRLLEATAKMCAHLRSMVRDADTIAEQMARGSHQLAEAAGQAAQVAGDQSGAAAGMASSMEEMSTSIGMVSDHASDARQMTEHFGEVSAEGIAIVDQAIGSMSLIEDTVRTASEAVAALGEQTQQISQVVNVISEIAEQTNLLALNAAIEAARAGETGRGFAVVADEVRKLAERTSHSTQEIYRTVSQIQEDARHAVAQMSNGVQQVEEGVVLASRAGGSIADIRSNTGKVSDAVAGISTALNEQNLAIQDIARAIERIARQAEENHERAGATSQAATDMEAMAARLRTSIAQFRA